MDTSSEELESRRGGCNVNSGDDTSTAAAIGLLVRRKFGGNNLSVGVVTASGPDALHRYSQFCCSSGNRFNDSPGGDVKESSSILLLFV